MFPNLIVMNPNTFPNYHLNESLEEKVVRPTGVQSPSVPKFWAGPLKINVLGTSLPLKKGSMYKSMSQSFVKSDTSCWKFTNLYSTDSKYC